MPLIGFRLHIEERTLPFKKTNAARLIYDSLLTQLPEIASLREGEGVILHYAGGQELHANIQHRGEIEELILAFYQSGKEMPREQACYEVQVNHTAKTAQVTPIRQDEEQTLFHRLTRINRHRVQNRELISRSGHSPTNTRLYQKLLHLFPVLETTPPGRFRHPMRRSGKLPDIYILQNDSNEMTLEISSIGTNGIDRMTVALDKTGKTANVTEISGAFGRYPSYLPYPDGKEMTPAERESYSRMLSDCLANLERKSQNVR